MGFTSNLIGPLTRLPDFDTALNEAMAVYDSLDKENLDQGKLKGALVSYVGKLQTFTLSVPNWEQRVNAYAAARLELDQQHKKIYRQIAKSPSLTLEYDFRRAPVIGATAGVTAATSSTSTATAPDESTARLVYVASILASEYTLTASADFFHEARPTMKGNFRDFQFGGKWDVPVSKIPFMVKGTLTFSGLFEHLHQKPLGIDLLINDQKVNQPGNIGFFQARYSIGVGDSGVSVPISFTASSRAELIKEKELRGNIGLTFDLDKLLAKK